LAYYTIANAIVTGICFAFGLIFLFSGLRRRERKRLNMLFAVFALAYAATLFNGVRFHNATSTEMYVAIIRGDTVFVVTAFVALIWYVAEYTAVKPRPFLWALTAAFVASGLAQLARTNLLYDEILGLAAVTMPWGEEVTYLEATDSAWSLLFLAAQLAVLVYMIFACVRQFMGGRHSEALVLSIGVLWFVASIAAEILGQAGVLPPIFYGEFGFLGFTVALSLQMANSVIRNEEELAAYRLNLEDLVSQRTAELEQAQQELVQQAQQTATADERNRIARDLHDSVTQTIYSATLITEVLPKVWVRNPEEGERNLFKLRQLVRGALAEMRTLLFELRPSALAKADLRTLLPQLSDAFTGRTHIPVDATVNLRNQPPVEVKTAIYRITQEALNNISKHAHATEASITLRQDSNTVQLTISDNGHGFNPANIASENMGIAIMQERAAAIQAQLTIESETEAGTQLHLIWHGQAEQNDE
jgi:signal transduction histidine kinase